MSYAIVWGEEALQRVPDEVLTQVLDCFEAAVHRLADSPTTYSRPAVFPYPPRGQVYHFHCDTPDGTRYYFAVFFYYAQNEQGLHVFDVAVA